MGVQPGLCRTWSETPKTGFLRTRLICNRKCPNSLKIVPWVLKALQRQPEKPCLLFAYEPRHEENRLFAYAKTKTQISFAETANLISVFVFATRIVQFLFYLNPKFQASSHLLWLYSPVCIGPGRKPRRPVFSERGSYAK